MIKNPMKNIGAWLKRSALLTFFLLCVAAFVFTLCSYNLYFMIKANAALVYEYGLMALMDGALQELAELVALTILSAAAYVLFKACEKVLVEKILK